MVGTSEFGPRVQGRLGAVEPIDPALPRELDAVEVVLFPDRELTVTPDPPRGGSPLRRPARSGCSRPRRYRRWSVPLPPAGCSSALEHLSSRVDSSGCAARCTRTGYCSTSSNSPWWSGRLATGFRPDDVPAGPRPRRRGPSRHRCSPAQRVRQRLARRIARLLVPRHGRGRTFTRKVGVDGSTIGTFLKNARAALHEAGWGSPDEYTGQDSRYDQR